jgi:hypothetical protein
MGYSASASVPADFAVESIQIPANGFIHIKLANRSAAAVALSPQILEKTFVTVYINNIRRAEYKVKYIDRRLFQPQGRILLRTNFRIQGQQRIKIVCNQQRIFKEINFHNNILEKTIRPNGK